ncbi:hypothetical protein KQH62_02935 [bacterium]|nr:hypothetical protein [bacterium]
MQEQAFRDYLKSRGFNLEDVQAQVEALAGVEERLAQIAPPWPLDELNRGMTQELVDELIDRGENSLENLLALARYAKAIDNQDSFVTVLDMLDGCEVMDNLYAKLGDTVGEDLRDVIFEDLPLPPLGLSRYEKAHYNYCVMTRMEEIFGSSTTRDLLKDSLRDLPDTYYEDDKRAFTEECEGDIDRYLVYRKKKLLKDLRDIQARGDLYFTQTITDAVIEYVASNPEIGGGVREGKLIYLTKIPYDTRAFLAETDPDKQRYHTCHCPWAKESLHHGMVTVSPTFCQCSAGFVKRPFEVIYGQRLQADVLQTVLEGDPICRFAVHLP